MRRKGRTFLLLGAFALLAAVTLAGCENPFDPMNKSGKIQGLSYIDFTIGWDHWDSSPLYDGVTLKLSYSSEFSESLSFHDKPHNVKIEFWTQPPEGAPVTDIPVQLFYSKTVAYANSADDIRIPVEAYRDSLAAAGFDLATEIKVFVIVRVYPPEAYPRTELVVGSAGNTVYKPVVTPVTPNS